MAWKFVKTSKSTVRPKLLKVIFLAFWGYQGAIIGKSKREKYMIIVKTLNRFQKFDEMY